MTAISTPCSGVCRLDPAHGNLCAGCGRSAAEIAAWPSLTESERLAIMAALPGRRSLHARGVPPGGRPLPELRGAAGD